LTLARGFERSDLDVRYTRGLTHKDEIEGYRAGSRGMATRVAPSTGELMALDMLKPPAKTGAKSNDEQARNCFEGPRLFPANRRRAADLQNRSALQCRKFLVFWQSSWASRRGWACPALVAYHGHATRAGQAQPLRDAWFADRPRRATAAVKRRNK
jgi:hypothetical protein